MRLRLPCRGAVVLRRGVDEADRVRCDLAQLDCRLLNSALILLVLGASIPDLASGIVDTLLDVLSLVVLSPMALP